VEQGKFLRPIEPLGEYLKQRGVAWTYFRDAPSLRLLDDQPEHGCDLCSRYRRRAVYEVAARPGRQRDRLRPHRRRFLRGAAAQHHVHGQAERAAAGHQLARPGIPADPPAGVRHRGDHARFAQALGVPLVPCGCSQKTGTVRRMLRDMFAKLEREYPHLKENILSAMGNVDTGRLLDHAAFCPWKARRARRNCSRSSPICNRIRIDPRRSMRLRWGSLVKPL
jgi:tRNA 2-thiocytidine biosynthesis protein TtcA